MGAESGTEVGAEVCAVEGAGKAGVETGGRTAGCAATAGVGAKVDASRWVETAAKATAMLAADRPPKIQGSKSRSLFIPRLSSPGKEVR